MGDFVTSRSLLETAPFLCLSYDASHFSFLNLVLGFLTIISPSIAVGEVSTATTRQLERQNTTIKYPSCCYPQCYPQKRSEVAYVHYFNSCWRKSSINKINTSVNIITLHLPTIYNFFNSFIFYLLLISNCLILISGTASLRFHSLHKFHFRPLPIPSNTQAN